MTRWYRNIQLRAAIVCATCISVLLPPAALAGDGGIFSTARSKLSRAKRATEYNHVEQLAMCIDKVEEELLEDGSVVAKAPDIWGEARLTRHRQEFERKLEEKIDDFSVRFNANVARSDQAFLASALALQSSLVPGGSPPASMNATMINNMLPAMQVKELPPADGTPAATPAPNAATMNIYSSAPGKLISGSNFSLDEDQIGLEPTIELDQLGRYLNHLHEIRRMNEGDDTSDSPGYSLNLVRIPISILPGSKTRKGYGAEITVTAEPHVTDELLPTTFRQLVVNDLVDQLSVPVFGQLKNAAKRTKAIDDAYRSTKTLLVYLEKKYGAQLPNGNREARWFTREGFGQVIDSLDKQYPPSRIRADLTFLANVWKKAIENPGSLSENDRKQTLRIASVVRDEFSKAFPHEYEALAEHVASSQYLVHSLNGGNKIDVQETMGIAILEQLQIFAQNPSITDQMIDPATDPLDAVALIWAEICKALANNAEQVQSLLASYEALNETYQGTTSVSAQRRARSPLSGQNLLLLVGSDEIEQIAESCSKVVDPNSQSAASSLRGVLRDELESAYDAVFHAEALGNTDLAMFDNAIIRGVGLADARDDVSNLMFGGGPESYELRHLLAWPIVVESFLLNRQLNEDMKRVSQDPECDCVLGSTGGLPFYGMDPPLTSRQAFVQYVKCRWPIHVFALDPMAQEQNIADQYSMRREMQLAMALSFAAGRTNAQNATRYIRRMEMDMETVALNRTAVAFGHGNDTFGWRFTPRVQTPDFESNATTTFRDLVGGGPNRDDLRKQWELEAGMRECVAIVLMPSFITHVRFDARGHFFPLTCDRLGIKTPSDARASVYDNVELSRMIRQMQDCAQCALNEQHLYRNGEVDRLLRRVDQLENRLPLQTSHSRVPNENTLGGFEMFSSGVTDLAPELYDFYGEPGFTPGEDTKFFLVGNNFSVTGTRVIAGNRDIEFDLLSREVMEITIPANAIPAYEDGEGQSIDVHVATPYGVSPHVHIPVIGTDGKAQAGYRWSNTKQDILYRWTQTTVDEKPTDWTVNDAGIMLRRPHQLAVLLPENQRLPAATADIEWTASFSLEGKELSPSDNLILINKTTGVPLDAESKSYLLQGASFHELHRNIRTGVVSKLKEHGQKLNPPEGSFVIVQLKGRVIPAGGSNLHAPIEGAVELKFEFVAPK